MDRYYLRWRGTFRITWFFLTCELRNICCFIFSYTIFWLRFRFNWNKTLIFSASLRTHIYNRFFALAEYKNLPASPNYFCFWDFQIDFIFCDFIKTRRGRKIKNLKISTLRARIKPLPCFDLKFLKPGRPTDCRYNIF